jgi:hypothetical protein
MRGSSKAGQRAWTRGGLVGTQHGHGHHATEHALAVLAFCRTRVGYNVGRVDNNLGWILAELDLGPNTKFEAHSMLYKIYLGFMTISALD